MQWKLGGSSELQRVVLYAVNVHISSVNPSELYDLLVLLSRLSIRWSSLHSQLKSALFACIASSLSTHDLSSSQEVSSRVMAALGLLGASWSEVPLTTQHGLVASLSSEGQPLSWDCLCDCLLGVRLLQIQLTADDTTAALRGVVLKSLKGERLLPERSMHSALPQRWVEVMASLPHFNFTQPQDCLPFSSLLLPLVRHHRLLQGSEVVSLLVSLAALEVGWSDLTVEVQRALVQAVSERASQWDCQVRDCDCNRVGLMVCVRCMQRLSFRSPSCCLTSARQTLLLSLRCTGTFWLLLMRFVCFSAEMRCSSVWCTSL